MLGTDHRHLGRRRRALGMLLGSLFFIPGMVLLGGAIGALMGTFK